MSEVEMTDLSKDVVPLSDMIEMLRRELQDSLELGLDQPVSFDVNKVELELKVVVSRKTEGGAGLSISVLKADGTHEVKHDAVHSFKLSLSPVVSATGLRLRVASRSNQSPPRI
jgi:hypothetical protein